MSAWTPVPWLGPEPPAADEVPLPTSRTTRIPAGPAAQLLTKSQWVIVRDGGWCRYCEMVADTVDHVIPRSRLTPGEEGRNAYWNLVACCATCNQKKGDRTPEEAGMVLLPTCPIGSERAALLDELGVVVVIADGELRELRRDMAEWRGNHDRPAGRLVHRVP